MALRNRGNRTYCSTQGPPRFGRPALGFTLIEMLVSMAITLVMMGAVVTLFANLTNSVRNRRATTEMSGQLRHVRNVLQQDLQGATCPGVTWQRPESNHGYIEINEGWYREGNGSNLVDADPNPLSPLNPEIDHAASTLPSSNLNFTSAAGQSNWATDGGGVGDFDDVLMLTSRNEHEPFVGRVPTNVRQDAMQAYSFDVDDNTPAWSYESAQSPLAEVVWFAVENPGYTDAALTDPDPTRKHFFGEPGYRTVYRRALLIAPWLNPYRYTDPNTGAVTDTFIFRGVTFKAEPGLLRILPDRAALEDAIAAIVAFQDRYDISARLEWDANMDSGKGRWKIVANTLSDLTKRENRFCHFGYVIGQSTNDPSRRRFPFELVSMGLRYTGNKVNVSFANDPELTPPSTSARASGYLSSKGLTDNAVVAYEVDNSSNGYKARPFAYISDRPQASPIGGTVPDRDYASATAQAILNDNGEVMRVVHGPVPLWGSRRGEDVMMTDVLAFDLRVYDPGAPVFASRKVPGSTTNLDLDVIITPSDPGWRGTPSNAGNDGAYLDADNMGGPKGIYNATAPRYQYVGQGAYVDMGYGYDPRFLIGSPPGALFPAPYYKDPASSFQSAMDAWFFAPNGLKDVYGHGFSTGYCVYDTWSFHYENNGIDEDHSGVVDQGTNGLDDRDFRTTAPTNAFNGPPPPPTGDYAINGIDDVGERETTPPYDKPLRGMQALIRAYERDSRGIRQVRVSQHFMQE